MTKVQGDKDSPFTFTGYLWHQQSGLNLTLYRAYDPNLGRWISRDPIQELGGINYYRYVSNNPINHTDKYGLKRDCAKEQIDCFNSCYQKRSPFEDCDSTPEQNRATRYRYCQSKCLALFMLCEAENELEEAERQLNRAINWCRANPLTCSAAVVATALAAYMAAQAAVGAAALAAA